MCDYAMLCAAMLYFLLCYAMLCEENPAALFGLFSRNTLRDVLIG